MKIVKTNQSFTNRYLFKVTCFAFGFFLIGFHQKLALAVCDSGSSYGLNISATADSPQSCEQKALIKLLISERLMSSAFLPPNRPLNFNPRNVFTFLSVHFNNQWRAREYQFNSSQFPGEVFTLQLLAPLEFSHQIIAQSAQSYQYSCTLSTQGCHGYVGYLPGGGTWGRWGNFGPQVVRLFNGHGQQLIRSGDAEGLGSDEFNPTCPLSWSWACD